MDPVGANGAGSEIGARADQGIHVEIAAVRLGAKHLPPRPQRLEPPPHQTDVAPGRCIGRPVLAVVRGRARLHRAVALTVAAAAMVPLGIAKAGRACRRRSRGGAVGDVEIHADAARRPAIRAAQRQLVHIVGRPTRGIGILVVVGAADVHRLGREQQIFALVDQGQRVAALAGLRPATPGAPVAFGPIDGLGEGAFGFLAHRSRRTALGTDLAPKRAGQEGTIAAWRPDVGRSAGPYRWRRTTAVKMTDQRLDLGLGRRQVSCRALLEMGRGQGRVPCSQAWKRVQHHLRALGRAMQPCEVVLQWVVQPRRGLGASQEGHQPDIEVAVKRHRRQTVEYRGQQHQLGGALGYQQPLFAHAKPLGEVQAVVCSGLAAGDELEPMVAAHGAKQHGKPAPLVLERHGGIRKPGQARPTADQAIPQPAELLLILKEG